METKIFDLKDPNLIDEALDEAASAIKESGIVVFPTETVYGLGANALDEVAVKKIYEAKGRPSDNPLIVHFDSVDKVGLIAKDISEKAYLVMNTFMPGPITVILKRKDIVPDVITAGLDTVAVRIPSNKYAHDFIARCNCPIAAPSANISGYPSPTREAHVLRDMDGRANCILLGGDCEYGLESTVIDMSTDVPTVLRPGAITAEQLEDLLGYVDLNPGLKKDSVPKAPGMKYKHYKPNSRVICLIGSDEKVVDYMNSMADDNSGFAVFSSVKDKINKANVYDIGSHDEPYKISSNLFEILRRSDVDKLETLYIMCLEDSGVGRAYRNRLFKACDEIIEL